MKRARLLFIIVFFAIGVVPLIFFNFERNSVSEIDNRVLQEMPVFSQSIDTYLSQLRTYVDDRIGLREEIIQVHTDLNNNLFHEMNHPNYDYGQEGHVFGKLNYYQDNSDYVKGLVEFTAKIQKYCEERGIEFIFTIEPQKSNVYPEYLPAGYQYNHEQLDCLYQELNENNIRYVDNVKLLNEKADAGEQVFNVAYDVNHWNGLGALYGIDNILKEVGKDFPAVEGINMDDFNAIKRVDRYLPISKIEINEENTYYELKEPMKNAVNSETYKKEIKINENYPTFAHFENEKAKEGAPDLLLFRGSYFTGHEQPLQPEFRQLTSVHNYQNIIDFEYYVNVFQPDCVVFETVEYVFTSNYFDLENMRQKTFNPGLETFVGYAEEDSAEPVEIKITKGQAIASLTVDFAERETMDYIYLQMGDDIYDVVVDAQSGQALVSATMSRLDDSDISIIGIQGNKKIIYKNLSIVNE